MPHICSFVSIMTVVVSVVPSMRPNISTEGEVRITIGLPESSGKMNTFYVIFLSIRNLSYF